MKKILENEIYIEEIEKMLNLAFIEYEKLKNQIILISGATGMIGSFMVDTIMKLNERQQMNCKVYAIGRNEKRAKERFDKYWTNENFKFISADINFPLSTEIIEKVDFVIHLASNTHPMAYATDPIGTITTNIEGTRNMLDFSVNHKAKRFVFASSCEIYGENRGDTEKFGEKYLGYIDCNTMRAGYPESKRCGEALCQAYMLQKNIDIVIPRLSRIFGPTMLMSDSKALSQFIKNGINCEDIILKSDGNQYYSYLYVADAVSAIIKVMLDGQSGEAYNVSDEKCDIKLKDLAGIIANIAETKVVFEQPNSIEAKGFSKASKARLDNEKIEQLGWKAQYNINDGVKNTIRILKGCKI